MEVTGCGMDVVVGRIIVGDVATEVAKWTEELLREGALDFLTAGFGGREGPDWVVAGPDYVAQATTEFEATAMRPRVT